MNFYIEQTGSDKHIRFIDDVQSQIGLSMGYNADDNQFEIMHNILFNLDTKELKKILSLAKSKVNYEKSVKLSSRK